MASNKWFHMFMSTVMDNQSQLHVLEFAINLTTFNEYNHLKKR